MDYVPKLQDRFSKILANVIEFFWFFGQTFWKSFNTNHEQGFSFHFWKVGRLEIFNNKLERTLEKIKIVVMCWQHVWTKQKICVKFCSNVNFLEDLIPSKVFFGIFEKNYQKMVFFIGFTKFSCPLTIRLQFFILSYMSCPIEKFG